MKGSPVRVRASALAGPLSWVARSGLAREEVLGVGGAGEFFAHQAGQEQQRAPWPVVRRDVLGLPGGVASDQDDTADGLAADLSGVVLEPAVVAAGTGELDLLVVIQR